MSRRNHRSGQYRFRAEYREFDPNKSRIVNGMTLPIEGEENYFVDEGEKIRFKYSTGKGLTKVQFQLFQNWMVISGNQVIETPSDIGFQTGESIILDGEDNIINRIEVKRNDSRQLRGNRQRSQSTVQILFLE